jgi:bifunctional N-acetylglucosamine-1-phosphate-uridyltransferase/glucosamine-1-phosphate-acetyltransferase GlmU-like protein
MAASDQLRGFDGGVLVCCGDMPLLGRETYETLASVHFGAGSACTILSGTSDMPLPYGRIVRDRKGEFLRLVEEKDASPKSWRSVSSTAAFIFSTRRNFCRR